MVDFPDLIERETLAKSQKEARKVDILTRLEFFRRLSSLHTSSGWKELEESLRVREEALIRRIIDPASSTEVVLRCTGALTEVRSMLSGPKLSAERVSQLEAELNSLEANGGLPT